MPASEGFSVTRVKEDCDSCCELGTRLLSVTKEQPKEMLQVFAKADNGALRLKSQRAVSRREK